MSNWVYLKRDFNFRPNARTVLAFKGGTHVPATQQAADAIVAAGAGDLTGHEPTNEDAKDGTQPVRKGNKLYHPKSGQEITVTKVADTKG